MSQPDTVLFLLLLSSGSTGNVPCVRDVQVQVCVCVRVCVVDRQTVVGLDYFSMMNIIGLSVWKDRDVPRGGDGVATTSMILSRKGTRRLPTLSRARSHRERENV